MFRYQKLLVPLDGSELGETAIPPALHLAEKMSAAVVLLRAVPAWPDWVDMGLEEKLDDEAQSYLDSVCAGLAPAHIEICGETVSGAAAKSIVHFAAENCVDLIVICSHGRSGLSRWVLGSVTSRVLSKAPCSTLVIRAKKNIPLFSQKRILVPLDGSPLAENALLPALGIAKAIGGQVTLLSVVLSLGELAPAIYKLHLDQIMREEQVEKTNYLHQLHWAWRHMDVAMETVVETGKAEERIITCAQRHKIDLIVMSSHGRSGMEHWAFGSVTEKVLQEAPCATLIVRGETGD
jgi:nucleotide-binding universal stress UspA family protein